MLEKLTDDNSLLAPIGESTCEFGSTRVKYLLSGLSALLPMNSDDANVQHSTWNEIMYAVSPSKPMQAWGDGSWDFENSFRKNDDMESDHAEFVRPDLSELRKLPAHAYDQVENIIAPFQLHPTSIDGYLVPVAAQPAHYDEMGANLSAHSKSNFANHEYEEVDARQKDDVITANQYDRVETIFNDSEAQPDTQNDELSVDPHQLAKEDPEPETQFGFLQLLSGTVSKANDYLDIEDMTQPFESTF